MPKPITYPQFHEAMGSALTAWTAVEDAFCDLFTRLIVCAVTGKGIDPMRNYDGYKIVAGVFHSTSNLKAKIEMIDRIFQKLVTDADLLTEWDRIKDKQRTLYGRRNVMAHGHVWGNAHADFVAYPFHAESRRTRLTYMQVCGQTPAFKQYEARITALAIAANALLAARA